MSGGGVAESFFCGGFGGICSVFVSHPTDTVKVRLQTMPVPKPGEPPLYSGILDCIKKSTKNEGIFFLYKGMTTPLLSVTPMTAVCFMGYALGNKIFGPADGSPLTNFQIYASGVFAGLCTGPVITPGDRIKSILQVQKAHKRHKGPLDCAVQLYKTGGIPSIFRGLTITTLRDATSTGVYFLSYDLIRRQFLNKQNTGWDLLATMFSGGVAGATGYIIAMPADVIKSKIQASLDDQSRQGIRQTFKEVMATEGVAGLFKGGTLILLRAFLTCSVCFLCVTICKNSLKDYKTRQKNKTSEVVEH
ncbi:congested-like trachea protein [Diabrotica virgifera virgifera]|uniref:Congested-like trachea protein n=1 Tax=Diabrotica virgifera virgifera TaxID=50390 RepID=A0ABM5IS66_DIAVI|nr:congested-like trachea protein [Diabrotica virgifera virgifera]